MASAQDKLFEELMAQGAKAKPVFAPEKPNTSITQLGERVKVLGAGREKCVDIGGIVVPTLDRVEFELDQLQTTMRKHVRDIEKAKPREVIVKIEEHDKRTITIKGAIHYQVPQLVKLNSVRDHWGNHKNILLKGEAGGGKSTAIKQIADAQGLSFGYIGQVDMPHDVIGAVNSVSGVYRSTPFVDAFVNGGYVALEEFDAWGPRPSLVINPALANGWLETPDGKKHTRHPDCHIIACANTWGTGATATYVGRNRMDAATMDRFVKMDWMYDEALERKVANNGEVVNLVQSARFQAHKHGLKVMISPRSSIDMADMVRAGFSMQEAADMTFLATCDEQQRKVLLVDADFV